MLVRVGAMSDSGGNGQAHIVKEDGSEDWGTLVCMMVEETKAWPVSIFYFCAT
jgi:hypothetical protein